MVRAILESGSIRTLDPLPPEWREGEQLFIEAASTEDPAEIAAWAHEIEEAASHIPDEDHARFLEALDEQRSLAKEVVRRQMVASTMSCVGKLAYSRR